MTFQYYQVFSKRSVVLRSLVIGIDERLQNEARVVFGRIISPVQHAVETTKADGLRAEVISYFMYNFKEYKDLDLAVINSNMPVQFASVGDRIIAMTVPKCLPGYPKKRVSK